MVIRVKNIFSVRFVRFVRFLPRKGHSIFFQILRDFEPCDPSLSPSDLRKPSPRPFSRCPTFGHLARRLFRAVRPSDTPSCALPTFSDLRTLRPALFRRFPTFGRSVLRPSHVFRRSDTPSCALPTFSDLRTLRPALFRRFPTFGRSFAVSLPPLRAAARYTL